MNNSATSNAAHNKIDCARRQRHALFVLFPRRNAQGGSLRAAAKAGIIQNIRLEKACRAAVLQGEPKSGGMGGEFGGLAPQSYLARFPGSTTKPRKAGIAAKGLPQVCFCSTLKEAPFLP